MYSFLMQFNIGILKTQNHALANKVSSLKSRLKEVEGSEDKRRAHLADCSQAVDTFTSTMRRVNVALIKLFESILQARNYSSLGDEGRSP